MNTTSHVKSSVKITLAGTIASGLIQACAMAVLARLLVPDDYGIYAIAIATNALTAGFVMSCFDRASFINSEAATRPEENILLPLAVAAVAIATLGALFLYGEITRGDVPLGVIAITMLSSIVSAGLIRTKVYLRRQYKFRQLVALELSGQLIGGVAVSIALAYLGWGAYSIVTGGFVSVLVFSFLCVISNRKEIHFNLEWRDFVQSTKSAVSIGRVILLEVINGQIPTAIIGAMLGTSALGIFNRAFTLIQLPVQLLTTSVNRVVMSAIKDVADDRPRLGRRMARLVTLTCAMISPIVGGIIGSADGFTHVILGGNFLDAAALVPPLAISTWSVMLGALFGMLAEASRHVHLKIVVQAICSVTLAGFIFAGAANRLELAALGMAIGCVFFLAVYLWATLRITGTRLTVATGWLLPGLGAGIACYAVSTLLSLALHVQMEALFACQIAACGLVTLAYYGVGFPKLFHEVLAAFLPGKAAVQRPQN